MTGTGGDEEIDIIYHDTRLRRKAVNITLTALSSGFQADSLSSTQFFGKNLYN